MRKPVQATFLILAAFLDAATMLLLPPGAELNPIAIANPPLAVVAKAALVVLILAAPLQQYRFRVMAFGAVVWSVGAISNAIVIAG